VREQVAQRDRALGCARARRASGIEAFEHLHAAQFRQPFRGGAVQVQLALFHQLHCGRGRERLRHRRDQANRVDGHRHGLTQGAHAERAFVDRVVPIGDHADDAGHVAS